MSAFNRVVASLAALVVLAGAIIVVLVATEAISYDFLPVDWFDTLLRRIADASGGKQAAVIAGGIVLALLLVLLLIGEARPPRRRPVFQISSGDYGQVSIDRYSLRQLAENAAEEVRNVRDAQCEVRAEEDGLQVTCLASVSFASSIPEISAEVQAKVKEALEQLTGLAVAGVDVKTRYAKSEGRKATVR